MICAGRAAIDFLAGCLHHADPGASSHWRQYHASFTFLGERFEGLQGFGGCEPAYRGPRATLHRVFQRRFRRLGAHFPEFRAIDRLASEVTRRQGRAYDLDVLRQSLTLAFLKSRAPNRFFSPGTTACVIGDGFASLTSLLLANGSVSRVVLVNLTKTLLVDLWYLRLWMGAAAFDSAVDLVTNEEDLASALAKRANGATGRVLAIQAAHHELLRRCPIGVAMNIASMQEMNPPTIAGYFDDLRAVATQRDVLFYCCNREHKRLPDGTVTRFSEYPWSAADRLIVDELCPWHQQYYCRTPPFYRTYDGPIRHRLVALARSDSTIQDGK